MKIDVTKLKNEKKTIYNHLWKDKELPFEVIEKGKNDPSYEFEFGGKDLTTFVSESIANNFAIMDKKLFLEKFTMACSGSGDEMHKITTMHSSSLCSLLFFFNVSETNQISIDGCKFTKSYFEFQNKVIGYPSNVDVVLLGKNEKGNNVLLFLESKFSEFITGVTKADKKFEIGKTYFKENCYSAPVYNELFDKNILNKLDENHVSANETKYIEGIKQMISHYYGIRNFIDGKYYDEENEIQKEVINFSKSNDCQMILGTVLFDNLDEDQIKNYLNPYISDYKKLAEIINGISKENNVAKFKMLEEPLKYSDFKSYISDFSEIQSYYFGKW